VPEPSAALLLGLGVSGIAAVGIARRWRRRARSTALLIAFVLLIAVPAGATTFEVTGGFAQFGHVAVGDFYEGIARLTGPGLRVDARTFAVPFPETAGNALATGSTTIAYDEGFFNDFYLGPGAHPPGFVWPTFTHPPITGLAGITSTGDLLARAAVGVLESAPFTMTGVLFQVSDIHGPNQPSPVEVARRRWHRHRKTVWVRLIRRPL
jgi:hypothetical protein